MTRKTLPTRPGNNLPDRTPLRRTFAKGLTFAIFTLAGLTYAGLLAGLIITTGAK